MNDLIHSLSNLYFSAKIIAQFIVYLFIYFFLFFYFSRYLIFDIPNSIADLSRAIDL